MTKQEAFEWRGTTRDTTSKNPTDKRSEFVWRGLTRSGNAPIGSGRRVFGNNGRGGRLALDACIGDRFGELVVLGQAPSYKGDGSGGRAVFVKCDCGTEKRVRLSELMRGKRTGCGQRSHWKLQAIKTGEQIVGQRFGVLTVVAASATQHVSPGGSRATQVMTRCDCGAERWARVTDLKGGHVQSCGGAAHKTLAPTRPRRLETQGKRQTYALEAVGTGLIKIGASRDFRNRLWKMQPVSAVELKIFAFSPDDIERKLHITLNAHRAHGEWFMASDEVMSVIRSSMRPCELSVLNEFRACRPGLARRGKHQCKRCGGFGHHAKTCSVSIAQVAGSQ
jgi:hypothetical protein